MTNHVVVAMIEDEVKQTRCSTCDADHEYKQARIPAPRRPKSVGAISEGAESFEAKPVLAVPRAVPESSPGDVLDSEPPSSAPLAAASDAPPHHVIGDAPVGDEATAAPLEGASEDASAQPTEDEGPVHRRLIRATLPRPEGHVPERKEPEFTIRQPGARGGREVDGNRVGYRPKGQRQSGGYGGHSGGGGHSRFGGQRPGSGPHSQRQGQGGGRGPDGGQRGGRPDGGGNRGQRHPGSGRRRGGR